MSPGGGARRSWSAAFAWALPLAWALAPGGRADGPPAAVPPSFRIATYNLENYHLSPGGDRPLKTAASRAQVVASLAAVRPDILAVEELAGASDLEDLAAGLRAAGLDLPYRQPVPGWDTNIITAALSRFPFLRRELHTNEQFLLDGRRFHASRGIGAFDFEPAPGYRCTVFVVHLKSRRPSAAADEEDLRGQEAVALRRLVDARLDADPEANIAVCGDLNDAPGSRALRTLLGRGRRALVDTRPSEREMRPTADDGFPTRRSVTWTHFYAKEDVYSRIDYILVSAGMAREWLPEESFVYASPNWGLASDHRPVAAQFAARER